MAKKLFDRFFVLLLVVWVIIMGFSTFAIAKRCNDIGKRMICTGIPIGVCHCID